jgi:hypothetical protein
MSTQKLFEYYVHRWSSDRIGGSSSERLPASLRRATWTEREHKNRIGGLRFQLLGLLMSFCTFMDSHYCLGLTTQAFNRPRVHDQGRPVDF